MLVTNAQLRSNVATSPEGSLIVDLTQVGDLDEGGRRLLAAQVVLSLAEVSVGRVRLLADGAPLLPSRPDLTRDDVMSLIAEPVPATAPALVVYNGRVHQLNGAQLDTALPGQVGNGELAVQSAAASPDGRRIAVVAAEGARRRLLIGGTEGPAVPTGLGATTMTRPSWTPTGSEAWTVVDSSTVARVVLDADGNPRSAAVDATELTRLGPVQDLRLSRDGLRVAAVVRGGLYAAALARSPDGDVTIRNVRALRPADIGDVVAVDWRAAETVVAVSRRADGPVSQVSVDGLSWELLPGSNLTPPLRAVAAAPNRPRAGDRPVGSVELRRRRAGDVAPGRGRRTGRGASLPGLTAAVGSGVPPVDNSAGPDVCGPVPSLRSGTLAFMTSPPAPAPLSTRGLMAALLDLLLPDSCGGCGAPGPGWCAGCAASLGPPLWPVLPGGPPVVAAGRYRGPLRTAVLAYKERGRRDLAGPLSALLAGPLGQAAACRSASAGDVAGPCPVAPGGGAGARAATTCSGCAGTCPAAIPGCTSHPHCGWAGGRATRSDWTPRHARRTSRGGSGSTPGRRLRPARR